MLGILSQQEEDEVEQRDTATLFTPTTLLSSLSSDTASRPHAEGTETEAGTILGPEAERSSSLYLRAAELMQKGQCKIMRDLETVAASLGTSRRHLVRLWSAIAEYARQEQVRIRDDILGYVASRRQAGVRPVAFLTHNKFDETPLRLQTRYHMADQQVTLTKVFVVEHSWCMVLRYNTPALEGHLCIEGAFAPQVYGAESATAETIANILQHSEALPLAANVFEEKWRLTDEGPNNHRAEAKMTRLHNNHGWQCAHTLCCAHKIHSIATKTWSLQKTCLTGVIRTLLTLESPGALARFQEALVDIACSEVLVRYDVVLAPAAVQERAKIMQLFAPAPRQSKRASKSVRDICDSLLNGDWQVARTVHGVTLLANVAQASPTPGDVWLRHSR